MNSKAIGLDFGTSNTALAVVNDQGESRLLALEEGKATLPSVVFYGTEMPYPLFGRQALAAYAQGEPGRLLKSLKSILGSALMQQTTTVQGTQKSYQDILKEFLQEVIARAQRDCGGLPESIVMGRPVQFSDDPEQDAQAEQTLRDILKTLGFKVIRFEFEPVAASFWFRDNLAPGQLSLIADLGGGTSDFCLLASGRTSDDVKLLATSGIHIAGDDFDYQLSLNAVMPTMGYRHTGPSGRLVPGAVFSDLSTSHKLALMQGNKVLEEVKSLKFFYSDAKLHQRLVNLVKNNEAHRVLARVEEAKIGLEFVDTPIKLDFIEHDLSVTINPEFVEKVLRDDLNKIVANALLCVRKTTHAPQEIERLFLTGGSSGLKTVEGALQAAFPKARVMKGDQFTSIALGLALSSTH